VGASVPPRAHWGLRAGGVSIAATAAVAGFLLLLAPTRPSPAAVGPVAEVLAGVTFLVTWVLLRLVWRLRPSPVVTGTAVAAGMVGAALIAVALPDLLPAIPATEPAPRAVTRVLVAVIAAVLVIASLRTEAPAPDPMRASGFVVPSVVVAVVWAAALPGFQIAIVVKVTSWGAVGLLYAMTAASVGRCRWLVPPTRRCLAIAVLALGVAQVATSPVVAASTGRIPAALLAVAVAVVAAGTCFHRLWTVLADQHRSSSGLETRLAELEIETRREAERLHELRSTVAGISAAARLLQGWAATDEARARLQETMCAEIERMNRLIVAERGSRQGAPAVVVDLDQTLGPVVEAHQLRGQAVEWEPTGALARVRPDDLAEVLDILIDNAHDHTGSAPSRVEVTEDEMGVAIEVTDAGPGIQPELRERIFDWGARGPSSQGRGIGLHVAQRLMNEQGGSLTLDDGPREGTSFVLRLPPPTRHEGKNGTQYHGQV
jgi:signal transduction histidine kinase